jgi:hypothetical protein
VLSLTRLAFHGTQVVVKVIPSLDFSFLWYFIYFIRIVRIAKLAIISQKYRYRTLMPTTSIQFSVLSKMTCSQNHAEQAEYQGAHCGACYPIQKVNYLFILFSDSIAVLVV